MKKAEIKKRVLKNGKPLNLNDFEWDEETKTFSTSEIGLVLDFTLISGCSFKTGDYCTFKTGDNCSFKTGDSCIFKTGSACVFKTGNTCTFDAGYDCTFTTSDHCTFNTSYDCTFNTGWHCTFNTGGDCTFNTGYSCNFITNNRCIFNTSYNCTFKTESNCTFNTGDYCTFKTESNCTFNTGDYCTFNTSYDCTFKTGLECVIVNRNVFEVIQPKEGDIIQICPKSIEGHLVNGIHSITGKKSIIADRILSEIISKKSNVYKVINHGETKKSFLVEKEINNKKYYSHGASLKEAKESLVFKISDRDLSKWEHLNLTSEISFEEAIMLYRDITGACREGTKYFVDNNVDKKKDKYSITELLEITKDRYGYSEFKNFFNK